MSVLLISVLFASLAGSMHCAGMCGGLMMMTCRSTFEIFTYHFGRLLGYAGLTALVFWIGRKFFNAYSHSVFAIVPAVLIFILFTAIAVQAWRGKSFHIKMPKVPIVPESSFLTGLFSVFLPCGWLHTYILIAAASGSFFKSELVILSFWIGTLPAMTATPWLTARLFRPFLNTAPKLAAILLFSIGAYALYAKAGIPLMHPGASEQCSHCHH